MSVSVMLGMSGGVDSTVAAYLLQQQGYDVIGATMRLYCREGEDPQNGGCSTLADVEDARRVAEAMGIPHRVLDFTKDFSEHVIQRFIDTYRRGETPNPCIDCNRYMKFGRMLQYAKDEGISYIATGHYARIEQDGSRFYLKKAKDQDKDQTYVLYSLTQEQLAHVLFPLGNYQKNEIRRIAEEKNFINAQKQDSQDICFVPDGDYASFIEEKTGETFHEGNFIDLEGRVLGRHQGIIR